MISVCNCKVVALFDVSGELAHCCNTQTHAQGKYTLATTAIRR